MTREEREQALEWFKNRPITMSGAKKMYDLAFEALSADGDTISRQAAMELVKDVCDAIMSGCESWYDPETEDEVYKDIREVDAILKCNKEVRIALRKMPSAQPDRSLWFHIGEVCVNESKGDIAAEVAIEKIRALLKAERREE